MRQPTTREQQALQWLRSQLDELLPRWLERAPTPSGLFHPHFDRQWNRVAKDFCTVITQNRLLFNFSVGYRLTGEERYLDAVRAGADAFLRIFWDKRFGGWFHACRLSDGEPHDNRKDAYGHAFAIFGLSHAALVTGDERYADAARRTWTLLQERFRDAHGGFVWWLSRDFRDLGRPRSQNPMMHLFEALLVLAELDRAGTTLADARSVADFVLNLRLTDDGRLPEWYRSDWTPLPSDEGGVVDVGHAFEWAFLLSDAVGRGLPASYLEEGKKLLELGLRLGYDARDGGIFSPVTLEGDRGPARKGWWEQCESTRALMHYLFFRGNSELSEPFLKTVAFVQKHYVDPEFGGWYIVPPDLYSDQEDPARVAKTAQPGADARFGKLPVQGIRAGQGVHKGFEGKVDYHVVGMAWEAKRVLEELSKA